MKKRGALILSLISFVGITSLSPSSLCAQKVWHKEVVDSSNQLLIGAVVLKVSPNKDPVISFISQPNQDASLEIRLKQNGEWKSVVTDPSLINISGLSMAIDSNDNFHFGLIRQDQVTHGRPVYSIYNQTSWATEEIDTFNSQYVDIELDSNGFPTICYVRNIGTQLGAMELICKQNNLQNWEELCGEWTTEGGIIYSPSITFDSKDSLHVAYNDWPNDTPPWVASSLNYFKYDEYEKTFEGQYGIVWGTGNFEIYEKKIVVNSANLPHILFVLNCQGCPNSQLGPVQLNHIYKTVYLPSAWTPSQEAITLVSPIDGAYPGFFSISMDIDSNDDLHILYSKIQDYNTAKIMYGHWDQLTWELSEIDSWKGTINNHDGTSFQTSLSVDSRNNVHIAYTLPQDKSGNRHKLIYGVLSENLPGISVTPMTYGFGNVKLKRSKTASFKVKNSGSADLIITPLVIGTDASMFSVVGGGGSKTIKPGRTLTIRVAFKPTSTGSKTSTLEITSNDPSNPTVDISLSGTGQ